jgi:hypothetical protein
VDEERQQWVERQINAAEQTIEWLEADSPNYHHRLLQALWAYRHRLVAETMQAAVDGEATNQSGVA